VARHIFQACPIWIYCTLRITSQASYSPEYITPTQKNYYNLINMHFLPIIRWLWKRRVDQVFLPFQANPAANIQHPSTTGLCSSVG
jgi:hypothetical protein